MRLSAAHSYTNYSVFHDKAKYRLVGITASIERQFPSLLITRQYSLSNRSQTPDEFDSANRAKSRSKSAASNDTNTIYRPAVLALMHARKQMVVSLCRKTVQNKVSMLCANSRPIQVPRNISFSNVPNLIALVLRFSNPLFSLLHVSIVPLNIIHLPLILQCGLDSITTILRITKQHLRTRHEEHGIRNIRISTTHASLHHNDLLTLPGVENWHSCD